VTGCGAGLRVLTVTNLFPTPARPAYGSFIASQVESLRAEGVETDVYFIDGKRSRWEYFRAFPAIRARLIRGGYQLVHAHYGFSGVYPLLCGRLPLVISFLGDDLLTGKEHLSWLKARVRSLVSSRAGAVIVKTEEMRRSLGMPDAHVIPNGVDIDRFRPLDRDACRRELGYDPSRRYVLFPYDPTRGVKDFDLAAAAMEIVRRSLASAELKTVFNELPERMPLHYNAADLLILTSHTEGSPNTVKEALACELPVVATPCGDVAERLEGVRHCHITPRSPAAVAEAVLSVLARRDPRSDGRDKVSGLEIRATARRIINVYRSVL